MRLGLAWWLPVLACSPIIASGESPSRVVSINLCTDQLLLALAEPQQVASVSWLASDPSESAFAVEAANYPPNYGTAEELIRLEPDLIVAGRFTTSFSVAMAKRNGYDVLQLAPANSVDDVYANLRILAAALGREERAETLVARMKGRLDSLARSNRAPNKTAVLLRPGGFTVGPGSLADDLMGYAGLTNVAAHRGLDRWGSLALEALLTSGAEVVVLVDYREDAPSLANRALKHPAMQTFSRRAITREVPGRFLACGGLQSVFAAELMAGYQPSETL